MEVVYLSQENRFYVRVTPEACARLPEGAFNPATGAPVYAMRIEGEGGQVQTYFLLPGSDGTFFWVSMEDSRLARR